MTIQTISLEQTLPLRQKYLRPSLELAQCLLPEDDNPAACHFGAFQEESLVGVCSIYPAGFPHLVQKPKQVIAQNTSWRLRLMATEESVRHQGFGKALILAVETFLQSQNGDLLWCHARASAISFYEVLGFAILGDVFDVEGIGPHVLMFKTFNKS